MKPLVEARFKLSFAQKKLTTLAESHQQRQTSRELKELLVKRRSGKQSALFFQHTKLIKTRNSRLPGLTVSTLSICYGQRPFTFHLFLVRHWHALLSMDFTVSLPLSCSHIWVWQSLFIQRLMKYHSFNQQRMSQFWAKNMSRSTRTNCRDFISDCRLEGWFWLKSVGLSFSIREVAFFQVILHWSRLNRASSGLFLK